MSKLIFKRIPLYCIAVIALLTSCKKSKTVEQIIVPDQSFSQSFDDLNAAKTQGWVFQNLSDDPGAGWRVKSKTSFGGVLPVDGANLLYGNYLASNGFDGLISDWVISPRVVFQNGDKISFYAVSNGTNDGYPDRLQLRLNLFNTSSVIGKSSSDIGNFTRPLIDINPVYKLDVATGGFPIVFTKYEATITGLNQPDSGRFAFRYFVELQGGANGDELAIDKVSFVSASK